MKFKFRESLIISDLWNFLFISLYKILTSTFRFPPGLVGLTRHIVALSEKYAVQTCECTMYQGCSSSNKNTKYIMNFKLLYEIFPKNLTWKFTLGSGKKVFLYSSSLSVIHLPYHLASDDCYGHEIGLVLKRKKNSSPGYNSRLKFIPTNSLFPGKNVDGLLRETASM